MPGLEMSGYNYAYYTIVVDGMQYGQTTNLDKYLYIVDTGTTFMYLPPREYFPYQADAVGTVH